jgi:hypothetical protein
VIYGEYNVTSCSLVKAKQETNMKEVASREAYFLTLKMEGFCCSETSVDCDRITQRYVSHDIRHTVFLHKSIILHVDLYGCGTWSLTLKE